MDPQLTRNSVCVREVWEDNLDEEFQLIKGIIDKYPFVGMDTEYPGVVFNTAAAQSNAEHTYQTLKRNVDAMNLIQLGLTFSDQNGNLPDCGTGKYCVWQFNFKEFNPLLDVYNSESIDLLRQSGIDFERHGNFGIGSGRFAELLLSSGIVSNDNMSWITFHGAYDFGYFLKLLTGEGLPSTLGEFLMELKGYFPVFYDVKVMMRNCKNLKVCWGLNKLANTLEIERIGRSHQAGSDSLLTSRSFFKMSKTCPISNAPVEDYRGILYGLGYLSYIPHHNGKDHELVLYQWTHNDSYWK